jgi:hypothetical protein
VSVNFLLVISLHVSQENISEARKKIVEGMDLIKNRQKLIKLADSPEAG